jgi:hypothetical protein
VTTHREPPAAVPNLYSGTRWVSGVRIVCEPRVKSWAGWPDDVRDTLHAWNRERRLSFVGAFVGWQHTFKCPDCERFIDPSGTTACRLDGSLICDDCIVRRARKAA